MKQHTIEHSKALDFILAGNSLFTVVNSRTGNRFTFKVKKHKTDNVHFVKVLTNPDVYQFIGSIIDSSFRHSKKSKISTNAQSVQVFAYIFKKLVENKLPEFIEIWHNGKCGRCGRALTVPSSIETGFGPECFKNI
jgi:hypothetical protein